MYFPSTHWSLLARASVNGETEAHAALGELCRRYWKPLNQFIRARGYGDAEAEDLTQEFLLHLLEHSTLRKPDPLRGKFRSFLLGALAHFLSHERARRLAQKRGGQQPHVSVELLETDKALGDEPLREKDVAAFDRAWALEIVRRALAAVTEDYAKSGRVELFEVLRSFLPGGNSPPPYEEAAARARMSLAAFNSEIHRLRRQFRECVYAEVTGTVSAPHEIDQEIAHLYRVLLDRGTDFGGAQES
jgi:DNA-directed RNA polymerase specialized sigma24 family protein